MIQKKIGIEELGKEKAILINELKQAIKLKDDTIVKISLKSIKTDMPVVLSDLTSRLMVMLIFDFLENPLQYQVLNRRFYKGIMPNWVYKVYNKRTIAAEQAKFDAIEAARTLEIRLTEIMG